MRADANNQQKAKSSGNMAGYYAADRKEMVRTINDVVPACWRDIAFFSRPRLYEMEKWKAPQLNHENYAFSIRPGKMLDLNYKQLYGTQVIWTQNGQASVSDLLQKKPMSMNAEKQWDYSRCRSLCAYLWHGYHTLTAAQQQRDVMNRYTYIHW